MALSCPNLPYFPIVYYGILKAGAVVVPLNVLLKGREVAYHLADSEAKAYFCFQGTAELPIGQEGYAGFEATRRLRALLPDHRRPRRRVADRGRRDAWARRSTDKPPTFDTVVTAATDTAVILYTSGTTGQAKGAELQPLQHRDERAHLQPAVRLQPARDTHLLTLPLFHSFGSTVQMNAGFSMAATLMLLPRFDAEQAVALMQKEDITFFAGVPTMWWGLLGALDRRRRRRADRPQPADRRLRRRQPAGGDHQAGQGAVPRADPRGLRALGDLAGRDVQRPRPRPAARLDRRPDLGGRGAS